MGCGIGHLARFFVELGCPVTCVNGRRENIAALRLRYPDLIAHVANIESDSLLGLGRFDIVFCYGLLYHLEDPIAALRNMAQVCDGLLLLETVVTDSIEPILRLLDEPSATPNQALGGLAGRPSPAYVTMALKRLGFPCVYAPTRPPQHPDFQFDWRNNLEFSRGGHLLRCIFVASRQPLDSPEIALLSTQPETKISARAMWPTAGPLVNPSGSAPTNWNNESEALDTARTLVYARPLVPYPGWTFGADWDNPDVTFQMRRRIWEFFKERKLEVPFVFPWYDGLRLNLYLGNDLSRQLFVSGCAEPNEFFFLNGILKPGMAFIDAGANDGLYTLFASRRVGSAGIVWSFEPSEREFKRLEKNVNLNQLDNVHLFRVALANRNGDEELSVAGFEHEGHNTLGAFAHSGVDLLRTERVSVRKLDDLVVEANLLKVDVVKMDVEGAEQRLIEGAREVLSRFRPVLLFEALDSALREQGSSRGQLLQLLASFQYELFSFDRVSGRPVRDHADYYSANMVAIPQESSLVPQLTKNHGNGAVSVGPQLTAQGENEGMSRFNPAQAYWNQRAAIAGARDRILALRQAVDHPTDLLPYQWAQLLAVVMEYQPDLVLELGRGKGGSTCVFTEASNLKHGRTRVLSLCLSNDWQRDTVPRLQRVVPDTWFEPLQALRAEILDFDYEWALAGAKRVLIFWDAHGFDIAECVLGKILPIAAKFEHLVIMHDLSDTRYNSEEQLEYGEHGLWKANNWSGPRVKLGIIDSAVEQSVALFDFATRNHISFDSADHSFNTGLTPRQQSEMRTQLGELFDTQGHWFYFTLNERPGPYKFPRFSRQAAETNETIPKERGLRLWWNWLRRARTIERSSP